MARVPSYGAPQVQVRNLPDVRISDAPAQAMRQAGAAIAGGVQDMAGVVGNIAMEEQEKANKTRLLQAEQQINAIDAELLNAEGGAFSQTLGNAMNLTGRVLPEWDKRTSEVVDSLPSHLKDQFSPFVQRRRGDNEKSLVRHAVDEGRKYRASVVESTVTSHVADAARNWANPDRVDEALTMAAIAQDEHLEEVGAPPEARRMARQTVYSKGYADIVMGMMAKDPIAAAERLEGWRNSMLPDHVADLDARLAPIVQEEHFIHEAPTFIDGGDVTEVVEGDTVTGTVPRDARAVQATYAALGAQHGFRTTSTVRDPDENRRVRGVPNSQHLPHRGTARDWSVKGKTPEQIGAFVADLKAAGFKVITETHGTGPHIHAELPKDGTRRTARAAPASLSEAVAAVRADPRARNPLWRKGMESAVSREWSLRKNAEAERDANDLDRFRAMAASAPPGMSPARLFGPEWVRIQSKGWGGAVESLLDAATTGTLIETNPATYDRFARMAVTNPAEFAKPQTRLEILKAGGELDTADLGRLLKTHADVNKPETRAKAIADHQTEAQRIGMGLRLAGLDDKTAKKPAKPGEKAGPTQAEAFGVFFRSVRQAAIANNGGEKLTPPQEDEVVRQAARMWRADSALGRKSLAAESLGVVTADVQTVRSALIARGNPNPTDAQIQAVIANYYRAANAD